MTSGNSNIVSFRIGEAVNDMNVHILSNARIILVPVFCPLGDAATTARAHATGVELHALNRTVRRDLL